MTGGWRFVGMHVIIWGEQRKQSRILVGRPQRTRYSRWPATHPADDDDDDDALRLSGHTHVPPTSKDCDRPQEARGVRRGTHTLDSNSGMTKHHRRNSSFVERDRKNLTTIIHITSGRGAQQRGYSSNHTPFFPASPLVHPPGATPGSRGATGALSSRT